VEERGAPPDLCVKTTPISLLERLRQAADEAAWDRFVRLYTPLLNHWGRRLGLNGPDVDDLVQEVFTVLVRKLPEFQYDRDKRFHAWLWTVTLNKHRQKQRRALLPVQAAGAEGLEQLAGPTREPELDETEYQQYVVQRTLQFIKAEFQPTTWQAFWECVVANRSPAEVAAKLNLSLDVVYAAKSRVLRRLHRDLEGLLS
jgi:RNA polymerase sigma-70 factor (ECF subfamily)